MTGESQQAAGGRATKDRTDRQTEGGSCLQIQDDSNVELGQHHLLSTTCTLQPVGYVDGSCDPHAHNRYHKDWADSLVLLLLPQRRGKQREGDNKGIPRGRIVMHLSSESFFTGLWGRKQAINRVTTFTENICIILR